MMGGSKRSHEGYLLIDHCFTPGISEEMVHASGLPKGAGQGKFEISTFTCSHCPRIVIMNPERTRPREWCSGCDQYICDFCAAVKAKTGICKTYEQVLEELQELAFNEELKLKREGVIQHG